MKCDVYRKRPIVITLSFDENALHRDGMVKRSEESEVQARRDSTAQNPESVRGNEGEKIKSTRCDRTIKWKSIFHKMTDAPVR